MRKFLAATAAAAVALVATPASAASFIVTHGTIVPVPGNNNFKNQLAGLGLTNLTFGLGSNVKIDGPAKVTFYYLASESGFTDSFMAGTVSGSENNATDFGNAKLLGTATFLTAGSFDPKFTSAGSPIVGTPGTDSFGIFLPTQPVNGDTYKSVFFGFDDQINNIDDNHDDFIIRADISAIPEPATWAMMIGGFGLVGAAMRRRTSGHRTVTA